MVFQEHDANGIIFKYDNVSKSLQLNNNDITNEQLEIFIEYIRDNEPFSQVKKIFLELSNNVSELPDSISDLYQLKELYIEGRNKEVALPDLLYEIDGLETLSIYNCILNEVKNMNAMTALRYLRLKDSVIRDLLSSFPNRLLILDLQETEFVDELPDNLIDPTNPNETTLYIANTAFNVDDEDDFINAADINYEEIEDIDDFPEFRDGYDYVAPPDIDVSPIGDDDASPQGASDNDIPEAAQPSISLSESTVSDAEPVEIPEITDFTSLEILRQVMNKYKKDAIPERSYAEQHPSVEEPITINITRENILSTIINQLNTRNNFETLLLTEKVNFRMDAGIDMGGVKREVYTKIANELSRFTKINLKEDMEITPETECDEARRTLINDYKQLIQDINIRQILKLSYDVAKINRIYPEMVHTNIEEHLNKMNIPVGIGILRYSFTRLLDFLYNSKNLGYRSNISMKELFAVLEKAEYDFTRDISKDVFKLICMALFEMTEEHTNYFLELDNAKKAVVWMYINSLDDANYVANFKQQYTADKGKAFYFGRMGLPESIRPAESEEDEDDMTVFEQYTEYSERYEYNGILDIDEIIHSIYLTTDIFVLYYILNPEVELNPEQIQGFITNNLRFDKFNTNYVPHGYVGLKGETKTRLTNLIQDYTMGLSEEKIAELREVYPTQDAFLKKMFFFWTGSPIINTSKTYAITRTNSDTPFIFNAHTCFYWLELNERMIEGKTQEEFINAIMGTISGEGFNLAGGRRRRFKKTQKKKGKSKKAKRFSRTIKK